MSREMRKWDEREGICEIFLRWKDISNTIPAVAEKVRGKKPFQVIDIDAHLEGDLTGLLKLLDEWWDSVTKRRKFFVNNEIIWFLNLLQWWGEFAFLYFLLLLVL